MKSGGTSIARARLRSGRFWLGGAALLLAVSVLSGCSERPVSSTAYCDHGTTASGAPTHDGVVAMNTYPGSSTRVPFGTRFRIDSGPLNGKIVTVEDRIGSGSQFDVWMSSCTSAINYGRRSVLVSQS